MYVYIESEPGLWTVGFYDPKGKWYAESDHKAALKAAIRCHYLNGITAEPEYPEENANGETPEQEYYNKGSK